MDGKERKGAKAGGGKKVHLLAAVTHVPGIVIGQDKVAKAGKANGISHFKPLLEPLPIAGAVSTPTGSGAASAMLGRVPRGPAIVRNVIGGAIAMGVTYGVGALIGVAGI